MRVNAQPSTPKNPLEALDALEQWRVQDENLQKNNVRWPLEKIPLTVRIQPPSHEEASITPREIMAVLKQWEAASQGIIRFQLSEFAANDADILFQWETDTVLGRDFEVGHTHREVRGKTILQATITLILNPIIDQHLDAKGQTRRLHATILHEVGHALGLEHSEHAQDVMHYRGWQRPYLSHNDSHRIQQHYRSKTALEF